MVVEAVVVVEVLVVVGALVVEEAVVVVEVVMVVEVDKVVGVVVVVVVLLSKTPKPTTEASTARPIIALRAKRTEYGENIQLRFFRVDTCPCLLTG